MRIAALFVAVTGFLAAAAVAEARTLKVPSEDYPTIQSAFDAVVDGDTVSIAPGTYSENAFLDGVSRVKIKAKAGTVLQAETGVVLYINECSDVSIQGLTIVGGQYGITLDASVRTRVTKVVFQEQGIDAISAGDADGSRISKCTFTSPGSNAVRDTGSDDLLIDRNTATDVGNAAFWLSQYNYTTETGSNRARVSKNVVDGAAYGGLVGGDQIQFDRNRFSNLSSTGISFAASTNITGATAKGNVISTTGGTCIECYSDAVRVEKNDLTGGNYGVISYYPGTVVKSNKVRMQTYDGIYLYGPDAVADRNTVEDVGQYGIFLYGANAWVSKNTVLNPGDDGIYVGGTGGMYVRNRVDGAGDIGGYVQGTGNTLSRNVFTGSGGDFDLYDTNQPGSNTYDRNTPDPIFPLL